MILTIAYLYLFTFLVEFGNDCIQILLFYLSLMENKFYSLILSSHMVGAFCFYGILGLQGILLLVLWSIFAC